MKVIEKADIILLSVYGVIFLLLYSGLANIVGNDFTEIIFIMVCIIPSFFYSINLKNKPKIKLFFIRLIKLVIFFIVTQSLSYMLYCKIYNINSEIDAETVLFFKFFLLLGLLIAIISYIVTFLILKIIIKIKLFLKRKK